MTKADKEGQRKAPILRFKGFTDDWEQRKLGNIFEKLNERNKNLEFNDSKTISIATMKYNPQGNGAKKLDGYKVLRKGDVAFEGHSNKKFKFGRFVLNDLDDGIISPRFAAIRPIDKINIFFWKYYIHSEKVMRNILIHSTKRGTMMNELVYSDFFKQSILVPTNTEQNKVGIILNLVSNLLALYAKKSSCLDSCIAYFIRILYDDPQFFKQKNVQNSIIKSFKLDDILIKNNAKNKNLSILNVESISNKKGFISQKEQFDNYQVASKDLSNYYVIHPKDFAYNPSRINVGSIAYKSPNDVKGIVSPLYVSFKCKNDIVLDKYLWHWFKSTNFEHQRVRLSEGGVRDTLSFNQLSKMKISIPSFEIQRQTINLLEILIQYKEEVDLKLNNLKLIKNTLLQNMFL